MAGRTIKEKKILTVLGVVLAFAAFGLFYARIAQSWKDAWKGYDNERKRYRRECELIQRKPALLVEYDKEKSQMKMFDEEVEDRVPRDNFYHCLVTAAHQFHFRDRRSGTMDELENTADGMFDIRSISFKPNPKTGRFKGSFVVTCAYMRGANAKK